MPFCVQCEANVEESTAARGGERSVNDMNWVKSTLSLANGSCVEVANTPDGEIGVRNSRDPQGGMLRFTAAEWVAFLGGVRNGEFDRFAAS